jgi:polar amino acid transport system permease protein
VFAGIVWATVINTPGWAGVQGAFFDPAVAPKALPKVWDGFLLNLQVLGLSIVTVAAVALAVALVRAARAGVLSAAGPRGRIHRPLPRAPLHHRAVPRRVRPADDRRVRIPVVVLGVLAVTLTYSSYVAEVIRAGIEAVHPRSASPPARSASDTGRPCAAWCSRRRCAR